MPQKCQRGERCTNLSLALPYSGAMRSVTSPGAAKESFSYLSLPRKTNPSVQSAQPSKTLPLPPWATDFRNPAARRWRARARVMIAQSEVLANNPDTDALYGNLRVAEVYDNGVIVGVFRQ